MRNFVYQGDEESCGLASLKMLLLDLTKEKGYRYFKLEDDDPLSLEDITKLARREGVGITWKKALSKYDIMSCDTFPMLAMFESKTKGHLVYLKKGTKDKILVFDPASGPKWCKREDVAERFALIYGEAQLISKESCSYKRPKLFEPISVILPGIMSLLGVASLFAAFYFIGIDSLHLWAGVFLALYGVFMILSRFVSSQFSKDFDKKWLKYVADHDKKRFTKNYERYYAFKSTVFPSVLTVFESSCSVFGLTFLFGFNEPLFFLSAFGLAVYLFIESKTYRRKSEKDKRDLSIEEENLFSLDKGQKEQVKLMNSINKKANRIGEKSTYARIVYFAVIGALSLLPPLVSDNVSLNYYLFQFFGLVALGEAMRALLYFFENKPTRERAYTYFCDNFVRKANARYLS